MTKGVPLPNLHSRWKSGARITWLRGISINRRIDASTPPSLLLRLRNHDDDVSWQEFVDIYGLLIYDFCRTKNLQSSDSADVTQNVLIRIASAIRTFEYDPEKGLFRDWLARVVLNEIRRYVAKRRDEAVDPVDLDRDAALHREWNDRFQSHLFKTAIERCKPRFSVETWKLFELSWLEKIPPEQVAKQMGVGIEKVYVARCRVLKQLKQEVANLADDLL